MKKLYLLLASTFLFMGSTMAQNLLEWNFYNAPGGGKDVSYAPTLVDADISALELTRGLSPANNGYSHGFVATIQPNTTESDAIASGDYFEFKLNAKEGKASLSSIFAQLRTQNTVSYRWKYSLDGGEFKNIGEPLDMVANTGSSGIDQPEIDLTSISDLQSIPSSSTITFRMYFWGGTTESAQGFGFGKSTTISGTVPYKASLVVKGKVERTQDILAGWNMSTLVGTTSANVIATSLNANVSTAELSRGSSFTPGSLSYAYVSTLASVVTSKEDAKSGNHYYDLKLDLQPQADQSVSLKSLNYKYRRLAAAPANYIWAFSLDGGATFTEIGGDQVAAVSSNGENYSIDLSGVSELQSIKSVTSVILRKYLWGDETTTPAIVFGFGRYQVPGSSVSDVIYVKGEVSTTTGIETELADKSSLSAIATENGITISGGEGSNEVKVIDLSGRLLKKEIVQFSDKADEINLPIILSKGIYVVTVGNQSVKIIK